MAPRTIRARAFSSSTSSEESKWIWLQLRSPRQKVAGSDKESMSAIQNLASARSCVARVQATSQNSPLAFQDMVSKRWYRNSLGWKEFEPRRHETQRRQSQVIF